MEDLCETIKYRGYNIEIRYDNHGENPRVWHDSVGVLVYRCRRDSLTSDTNDEVTRSESLVEWVEELAYEYASEQQQLLIDKFDPYDGEAIEQEVWAMDAVETVHQQLKDEAIEALSAHFTWAPCSLNTNYTTGHVGIGVWGAPLCGSDDAVYYTSLETAIKEWGKENTKSFDDLVTTYSGEEMSLREATQRYLSAEFQNYADWCGGQVYGYTISTDGMDRDENGECDWIGSCWGFYGSDYEHSGLLEDARASIDSHIKNKPQSQSQSQPTQ